jgi:hypothetical protein
MAFGVKGRLFWRFLRQRLLRPQVVEAVTTTDKK